MGHTLQYGAPEDDHDDFICRKGYHSMILQAVVGTDTEMYDASTGFSGSMHDAQVLRLSSFSIERLMAELLH